MNRCEPLPLLVLYVFASVCVWMCVRVPACLRASLPACVCVCVCLSVCERARTQLVSLETIALTCICMAHIHSHLHFVVEAGGEPCLTPPLLLGKTSD